MGLPGEGLVMKPKPGFSRRERELMDIVYRLERATAAEIRQQMADPPSYSAVRTLLRILGERGHLEYEYDGPRYVYSPTVPHASAGTSALKKVLSTFFEGSMEQAVAALLDMKSKDLTDKDLDRLQGLIDQVRREGR